jgi:hypothetical protein
MIRRHDYDVDVAGGFGGAQYFAEYGEFQGLWQPTRRRAYNRGADGKAIKDELMVSLDVSNIRYS